MRSIIIAILLLICLYENPLIAGVIVAALLIYNGIPDIRMFLLDALTWYSDITAKIRFHIAILDITGRSCDCIPLKPPVRAIDAYYIRVLPINSASRNYKILTWFYREHSAIGKDDWMRCAALMNLNDPPHHYIELYDYKRKSLGLTIRVQLVKQSDGQIQRHLDCFHGAENKYLGSIRDNATLDQLTIQGIIRDIINVIEEDQTRSDDDQPCSSESDESVITVIDYESGNEESETMKWVAGTGLKL